MIPHTGAVSISLPAGERTPERRRRVLLPSLDPTGTGLTGRSRSPQSLWVRALLTRARICAAHRLGVGTSGPPDPAPGERSKLAWADGEREDFQGRSEQPEREPRPWAVAPGGAAGRPRVGPPCHGQAAAAPELHLDEPHRSRSGAPGRHARADGCDRGVAAGGALHTGQVDRCSVPRGTFGRRAPGAAAERERRGCRQPTQAQAQSLARSGHCSIIEDTAGRRARRRESARDAARKSKSGRGPVPPGWGPWSAP